MLWMRWMRRSVSVSSRYWRKTRESLLVFWLTRSWWKDASRDTLDIGKALTTLRKTIDLGKLWSSLSLVRASYIAMSVLYDEYNNVPDNALAVLDEAAIDFGTTDVHILNQRAKVVFRQGRDDG